MPDPRSFISFDFDHDESQRSLFVGQTRNSRTPFSIQDWSSKDELAQSRWEQIVGDRIARCNLMVVLIGRSMASAAGVAKEIRMATDRNVPFFGVYVDNADGMSALPSGMPRNRVVSWTWPNIANGIDQMMKEGKNRG
jgi:hypothetical protein